MKPMRLAGVCFVEVLRAERDYHWQDCRPRAWVGRAVVCLGVLGAGLAGWASYRVLAPAPAAAVQETFTTRLGAMGRSDPAVDFSLGRMHSFLSLGVPSELVRERILSERLARAIGRDGRALVADVLDYAHELIEDKPRRRIRRRFFRTLDKLNQKLSDSGLGHYVFASFDWDEDHKRIEQVNFDSLRITEVSRYRVGERVVRILHVARRGPPRSHENALGFTAPDYDEAFLVVPTVFYELHQGLLPARVPFGDTELFMVSEEEAKTPWYQSFRKRVGAVLSEDIGVDAASPERGHAALIQAVEIHELQHQIDYKDKLSVRGLFRAIADRIENLRLASACMHETSAHLAQMARDPVSSRIMLAEIVSYGFSESCEDADCLAALVILDELGAEFGISRSGELVLDESYEVHALADRYIALAEHSPADIARAAQRAWTRLFDRPLQPIARLP